MSPTLGCRSVAVVRLGLAAVLLLRPDVVDRAVSGQHGPPPSWLIRVLGGRSLLQGIVTLVVPSKRTVLAGAAVDATHALSMLPFTGSAARYRRAAVTSAAVAATTAAADLLTAASLP